MSGLTDENAPVPGSAVLTAGDEAPPEQDESPSTRDAEDIPEDADPRTRPCAYCGRPLDQPGDSSPAMRYCPDNGGACAQAAAERRRRDQDTAGLAGQVARTWDMVERLEDVAELLAISLTTGLSVAGIDRRLAEARAEAATALADAHREREAARLESEGAFAQLGGVRDQLRAAEVSAAELTAQLESARTERDTARDMGDQATRTAEAANEAVTALREERDRLMGRVVELTSALDLAHGELADAKEAHRRSMALEETRTQLRATESELDKMRTTAEIAQKARAAAEQACAEADRQALEARAHAEEMSGERDEIIAERDSLAEDLKSLRMELESAAPRLAAGEHLATELETARKDLEQQQSRLLEQQLRSREHSQMVDQLRGALATMISERDAARAEADETKLELERLANSVPRGSRHARPAEFGGQPADGTSPSRFPPFPGSPQSPDLPSGHDLPPGHDLGGVTGPPESFRRGRFLPPPEE
ncbi:hypothetical protein [Actinomadura sp. DC4]|uniref:hypothetical protein n=1 Tax=Actinomadura sp. DC4 TaxID=3055069 RepID=UPI0025B14D7B|nr:hypothetical protein [Actinomadura sp. DC4]MDN3354975.1 hypothetical protein [Actinomadura sp. DC4]